MKKNKLFKNEKFKVQNSYQLQEENKLFKVQNWYRLQEENKLFKVKERCVLLRCVFLSS